MIMWLASYPKSGNTWLRALLTTYFYSNEGNFDFSLLPKIGQFPQKNFFKSYKKDFTNIPDTAEFWIKAQEEINSDKKFRLFKTHNAYLNVNDFRFTNSKNTSGCIYIIRDPRNIVTSLKNHYEHTYDEALDFMTNDKGLLYEKIDERYVNFQFLSSWSNHYNSWLSTNEFPVKVIKYEDLEINPMKVMEEVVTFINKVGSLNKTFDEKKALKCIETSSFERLKKLENDFGFKEAPIGQKTKKKITFLNLGNKNKWKIILSKEFSLKINQVFKNDLERWSYKLND